MLVRNILICILTATGLVSCRTLNSSAEKVQTVEKVSDSCKKLGLVNVDWTVWPDTTEVINVLRNKVAAKGGNTLLIQSIGVGLAYDCPQTVEEPKLDTASSHSLR